MTHLRTHHQRRCDKCDLGAFFAKRPFVFVSPALAAVWTHHVDWLVCLSRASRVFAPCPSPQHVHKCGVGPGVEVATFPGQVGVTVESLLFDDAIDVLK
jgi:hypothetical protein